jgi:hypothetical protein
MNYEEIELTDEQIREISSVIKPSDWINEINNNWVDYQKYIIEQPLMNGKPRKYIVNTKPEQKGLIYDLEVWEDE